MAGLCPGHPRIAVGNAPDGAAWMRIKSAQTRAATVILVDSRVTNDQPMPHDG